jgi:serine/threonine-protein kinase
MAVKLGTIIDERYRITARIGHGGMAEVYEANDIINKKIVAIKFIREDVMSNPINLRRFENEATIAAQLNHPNIVKVYNHGIIEGRPYIAYEYISGQSLKEALDFRTRFTIDESVDIMIQLTAALTFAHEHSIIHRDIKPDNIFIMLDGTIKLGDFGIAQTDDVNESLTSTNEVVGSVHYMAPEIASGKPASIKSDIYATGVTFFELITGHVPFEKKTPVDVAVAQVRDKFPSVKKYLPQCPKEIEKIIYKAVKKNPKDRYTNMQEMHDDLIELKKDPNILKEKKGLLSRIFGFK